MHERWPFSKKTRKNEANCQFARRMDRASRPEPDRGGPVPGAQPDPCASAQHRALPPICDPRPRGIGQTSITGMRAAVRTVIRYRNGVLNGKGASLLDGYMEDLATDRIYRLMIAQRFNHSSGVEIQDESGAPVRHTPEFISRLFDEELERLLGEPVNASNPQVAASLREARTISEEMI